MKQIIKLTESELKSVIKSSISEVLNENRQPNFLRIVSPSTFNNAKMKPINETNAKRMIKRHSDSGYIIVSPCRGYSEFGLDETNPSDKEKLSAINNKRFKLMHDMLVDSRYTYTPVYGGFIENLGSSNEESVYEKSFIIYNQTRDNKEKLDFDKLYQFGLTLAKKFNQDSILVKAPNETPKYVTKDGNAEMEFGNSDAVFNDFSQQYFTDLHKNTDKYKDDGNRKPTRFTFTESYINPNPQCYSEAHVRYLKNEIFLPYKTK